MSDRKLDEVTGDFRAADGGGFEQCDVLENQIAFSFKIPLGSWEGDPELGHRLGELEREPNTAANRNRLRDLARLALQWLIDLGSLETVDVTVDDSQDVQSMGRVPFEVDYKPAGAQRARRAGPFLISVGGG
jgi:phage gp46-like protein